MEIDIENEKDIEILRNEFKKIKEISDNNAIKIEELNTELVKCNKELDDFAYIASHDLREPVRGIKNYSDFIMEDYADKLDDEGKDMLNSIVKLTKRLDQYIVSLLEFSRLGRAKLTLERVSIEEIVNEVVSALESLINEKLTVIDIMKNLPVIKCDRLKTIEIYRNLITNALIFNDKNERNIEIGHSTNENNELVLFVRDNGIGIDEKHFESIFMIFKRLHGREKYGAGAGAGLTIAKKCIEMQVGKIWLESEIGVGTTFYFTLPNHDEV